MSEIEHRSFGSALDAFNNLNADTVAFARLAKRKLMQLGIALSTMTEMRMMLNPRTRPGIKFKPLYGNSVGSLMTELIKCGPIDLSQKSWKCVKIRETDKVCFYSDAYEIDINKASAMAVACRNIGLDLHIFEWDYPRLTFDQNDPPISNTARVIGGGYKQLYRGKLVGFIIGDFHERETLS
jgi:hypothetical protein